MTTTAPGGTRPPFPAEINTKPSHSDILMSMYAEYSFIDERM